MKKEDVAIVVVSFDKYSDIWDVFETCINRFWGNRPYSTYLITNEKKPSYEGISVITTGKEESWSVRVNRALEKIKEKYLILLLEDYLIDEMVDNEFLQNTLIYVEQNNMDYFRIAPIPRIHGRANEFHAIQIKDQVLYGVNLQAAIWRKEYLKSIVSKGSFNAWEFEARQKLGLETRIEGNCYASNVYIIHYLNGIIQGKWYSNTINSFKSKGIEIPLGNRALMKKKEMAKEKWKNFLLHHIPPRMVGKLKPLAKKMGFKFVTE